MGADVAQLAAVSRISFGVPLLPGTPIQLHEELIVSDSIRALIASAADSDQIHRQAVAEGMRTLRQAGLDEVAAGNLHLEAVLDFTPEDS
jgi:type II secretory ATPase GspE/PulE/Tfp pilus assembly ATPase PilB-like protein